MSQRISIKQEKAQPSGADSGTRKEESESLGSDQPGLLNKDVCVLLLLLYFSILKPKDSVKRKKLKSKSRYSVWLAGTQQSSLTLFSQNTKIKGMHHHTQPAKQSQKFFY